MNTDNNFENQALIGVPRSSSVVKDSFPPAALSDAEILERLVALNKERAQGGFTAEAAKGAEKRQGQASSAFSASSAVKQNASGVTITQMCDLLAKLRSGEPFTPKEREQHEAAQTEILRQLHDELDAAVIEAYGWNQEQGNHRFTPMNTDNSF